MTINKNIAALLFLTVPMITVHGEGLFESLPATLYPDQHYVFYSHGLIVEGDNPEPVHPAYGKYEFPRIKQALYDIGGFNLIALHRPANLSFEHHTLTLKNWIYSLLDAGVPASSITLIGFSRGAQITASVASDLRDIGINTVLMAVCIGGDAEAFADAGLGGHLLSIYESSDVPGSCSGLAGRSELASYQEVEIATGRSHGAFYQPLGEWMEPLSSWLGQRSNGAGND